MLKKEQDRRMYSIEDDSEEDDEEEEVKEEEVMKYFLK